MPEKLLRFKDIFLKIVITIFFLISGYDLFGQSYVIGGKVEEEKKIDPIFFDGSGFPIGSDISLYLAREKAKEKAGEIGGKWAEGKWVEGVKIGEELIYYGGKPKESFEEFSVGYLQYTYFKGRLLSKIFLIYGDGYSIGEEIVKILKLRCPRFKLTDRPFDSSFNGIWKRTALFSNGERYVYLVADPNRVSIEFCTCAGQKLISDYSRDHKKN